MQAGIFFRLTPRIYLESKFSFYLTNTDYIDDVSGYYFNQDIISQYKGRLAARLADRHQEIDPLTPPYGPSKPRGNPNRKDQFMLLKIGVSIPLNSDSDPSSYKKVYCPTFK